MPEIHYYINFIAAIIIFQLIPGPGTLAIVNATARGGISAGFGAVAGTLFGDGVYMLGAVLGLAALMHTYPALFEALQWLGAGYLCWLGFQLLRTPVSGEKQVHKPEQTRQYYFRQAFTIGLTNPKVIVFFIALFPLFLSADASPVTLAVMMAHVTLISFFYQSFLVLISNAVAKKVPTMSTVTRLITRLAGIALIGFGAKLAINNQ